MKIIKVLLVLMVLISWMGCSKESTPAKKTVAEAASGDLVVAGTNDFHATLDRAEGLASVITDLRKKYGDRLVYLDAGDQFQGSLEGNISKGKAVVGFFNLIKLDAAAIGNHEFDYGPDVSDRITVEPGEDGMGALKSRVSEATYPFLSANLILDPPESCSKEPNCNALGQKTVFESHTILERNGQKVGIIGATTSTARYRTSPAHLKGARFEEMAPVVQAESKYLNEVEKCDWVLLTVHAGLRYATDEKTLIESELSSMLQKMQPPVDAVVGGDNHEQAMEVVAGIPVIQSGSRAISVGIVHLNKVNGKKQYRFDKPVNVPDVGVSFEATEFMRPYRRLALERKRRIIATAHNNFLWDQSKETALGNLVATAFLQGGKSHGGADFALINAGALREGLPAKTITYSHLFKLIPFDDHLVVVELTGSELKSLLEIAFSGAKGMPAIAGFNVVLGDPISRDLNGDGAKEDWEKNRLADVRDSKGSTLNNNKIYKLATLSYLVEGGDHQNYIYEKIPESRIHRYGEVMARDLIADYMKKESELNPADYYSKNSTHVAFKGGK